MTDPILKQEFEKASFSDKIPVILASLAVFYFSYIPFQYLLPVIGLEKNIIFVILVSLNLAFMCLVGFFKISNGRIILDRNTSVVLFQYTLFAIYALLSYSVLGDHLDDLFTIRTLILVNPIFVVFAIWSREDKSHVIAVTSILAFSYFVFLIYSMKQGYVLFDNQNVQNIFSDLENIDQAYQNINVYLGLFVISCLYYSSQCKQIFKIPVLFTAALSMAGMFLIGGRASVVAISVVLLLYLLNRRYPLKTIIKIVGIIFIALTCFIFIVGLSSFCAELIQFFQDSVTVRRFAGLIEGDDSSLRIYLFTSAVKLFLTSGQTILFGAGINSFPVYIGAYSTGMYPHNIVLELLCEYGVVGFFLFVLPIVYILYVRNRVIGSLYGRSLDENIAFLIFVYFGVISMFTGGLRNSWVLIYFTFLLLPSKATLIQNSMQR